MSDRVGEVFRVAEEKPQQCDLCGAIAELRPYGPNGEAICFDCGMKDEAATAAALDRRLNGVTLILVESEPSR